MVKHRVGLIIGCLAVVFVFSTQAWAATGWDTYVNAPYIHGQGYDGADQTIGIVEIGGNADNANNELGNVTFRADWSTDGVIDDSHATGVAGVAVGSTHGIASGSLGSSFRASGPSVITFAQQTNAMMDGNPNGNGTGGIYGFSQPGPGNIRIWNMSLGATPASAGGTIVNNGNSQLSLFLDYMATTFNDEIIVAAGNDGNSGANSVNIPADAYNVFTVGATGNAGDAAGDWHRVRGTSSEGMTSDGRVKPDIVAPGGNITMPDVTGGGANKNATQVNSGTSFAAPSVSGAVAVLNDMATNDINLAGNTDALDHRVIQAVMYNSADKDGGEKTNEKQVVNKTGGLWLPNNPGTNPLDSQLGSGQLNLASAYTQFNRPEALAGIQTAGDISVDPIAWDENLVAEHSKVDYMIDQTLLGGSKITATIDWDRVVGWADAAAGASHNGVPDSGDTFTALPLDNLDIYLVDGNGDRIEELDALGRASWSASTVDNIEQIYFTLPASGDYGIEVDNLADEGVDYGFAVWSHVPEPSSLALLAIGGAMALARRRAARA